MKNLFVALALLAASRGSFAQTLPPVPSCIPTLSSAYAGGPHIKYGEHGFHFIWGCRGPSSTTIPFGFSCRHGTCDNAAWEALIKRLSALSSNSQSSRFLAARQAWIDNVKVNCPEVLKSTQADTPPEGQADWLMCAEQEYFIWEKFGK